MRVLVTGAAGFLGRALVVAPPAGVEVVGTWRRQPPPEGVVAQQVDLADEEATRRVVAELAPDVVLHTAYGTADLRRDVVAATVSVAEAAAAVGAAVVHLSSDVVFSGEDAPYAEDTPPSPASAYGRAKLAAEVEVELSVPDAAIVRTSLVLTPETLDPRTQFVADGVRESRPVDAWVDEIRMPVHRDDLVAGLWDLVRLDRPARGGVWHLVGLVPMSRYDLAVAVCEAVGGDPALLRAVPSPRDPDDPRPRDLRLTADRAVRELGWRPRDVRPAYRAAGAPYPPRSGRRGRGH